MRIEFHFATNAERSRFLVAPPIDEGSNRRGAPRRDSLRRARRGAISSALLAICAFLAFTTPAARAQDWFRTGTGLGVSKPKVAVADFVSRNDASTPMAALFVDVVPNDLDYSRIFDLAIKSFDPHPLATWPMDR